MKITSDLDMTEYDVTGIKRGNLALNVRLSEVAQVVGDDEFFHIILKRPEGDK